LCWLGLCIVCNERLMPTAEGFILAQYKKMW
jgi:hypothetical protein